MTNPEDVHAIERVRAAHVTALNQSDAAALAGLFTPEGVQMPPNEPPNVGEAAIRRWLQNFLDQFHTEFALSPDEVRVAGDWAFERGSYTLTLSHRGGPGSFQDRGKYITIYERQAGGAWRMASDIWNSNQPPPRM
jgi:uncharacterized protein (TIGR02246 family)